MIKPGSLFLISAAWFGLVAIPFATANEKARTIPDFTKGSTILADAKHDWNLGNTGLRGWMYFDPVVTTVLHLLGIDHTRLTRRHIGGDVRLTDVCGSVVNEISW